MLHSNDAEASKKQTTNTARAVIVLSLCAAFLFYKYILQNFPSVMSQQLMDSFHLQGLGLGALSGVYFWTYLIVPLFAGIILDHYGTRWITTGAILCCVVGIYIFSQAEQLDAAVFGRTLTGVGVSFATISYLKLASVWFAKKHYALLTSLLVAAGMIGAVCGQMPLAWLVEQVGWRASLADVAWIGGLFALVFFIFVKDKPSTVATHEHQTLSPQNSIWQDILSIIKNKQNWLLTARLSH